jgi:phospholipase C
MKAARLYVMVAALGSAAIACGSGGAGSRSSEGSDDGGSIGDGSVGSSSGGPDGGAASSDGSTGHEDAGLHGDGGGTCPSPVTADPRASERAACMFTTGAKVDDTLGLSAAARAAIPIENVIVMMKENRAFDHVLGQLHATVPAVEAIPAGFTNPGTDGGTVAPFHQPSSCISHDPDHQWAAMHTQVNDGGMNGFVESAAASTATDGLFAMSYYDATDLPFYYWLASTYPLNDRHFASARSGTYPNRNFLLLGTADGVQSTGAGYPLATTPTIFDSLSTAGVTWGVYSDGSLLSGSLDWDTGHANTGSFADFLSLVDAGTLPQVAFVDGIDDVTDDHPTANMQEGEAWSRTLYEHVTASKLWPHTAMIWTYDEGGGFFDHVPPPNQWCVARPSDPPVGGDGLLDSEFHELGVRVPLVVISPYARQGYTSHVVQEHTAVTRFIETVFDLPALTNRDANSDALLDLFDFQCPPAFLSPPTPPASGTGGCDGSLVLSVSSPNVPVGTSFQISFKGGPGNDPQDWIGIYTYTSSGPTPPAPSSLMWQFIGGSHTASTSPASGSVTIDSSAAGQQAWPLPVGSYIAYYLLNDGYTSVASIDFNVVQ